MNRKNSFITMVLGILIMVTGSVLLIRNAGLYSFIGVLFLLWANNIGTRLTNEI
jgi:type IV secretory pathway VirB3-like protein